MPSNRKNKYGLETNSKIMKIGKCARCGKKKLLTKHSLVGNHRPPFRYLCRKCHDKVHNMDNGPKNHAARRNFGKYVKGTKRQHKKK